MLATRSNETVKYVSISDPALSDADAEVWKEYLRDFKEDRLPLKPGATPTVFRLKRLSRKNWMRIGYSDDQPLSTAMANEIVACGLKGVDSWPGGLVFGLSGNGDRERVSEESLDAIYNVDLFNELARVILVVSKLAPLGG